jgi:hypothetical protein
MYNFPEYRPVYRYKWDEFDDIKERPLNLTPVTTDNIQ